MGSQGWDQGGAKAARQRCVRNAGARGGRWRDAGRFKWVSRAAGGAGRTWTKLRRASSTYFWFQGFPSILNWMGVVFSHSPLRTGKGRCLFEFFFCLRCLRVFEAAASGGRRVGAGAQGGGGKAAGRAAGARPHRHPLCSINRSGVQGRRRRERRWVPPCARRELPLSATLWGASGALTTPGILPQCSICCTHLQTSRGAGRAEAATAQRRTARIAQRILDDRCRDEKDGNDGAAPAGSG